MKRIAIILANGFEEIEALAPIDYLRRAGAEVDIIGLGTQSPIGSHGITVIADITEKRADINSYDAVILPGGMPGSKNLDESRFVTDILEATSNKGGILAAICAAPMVLGSRGYLDGKKATCYLGFEDKLTGATIACEDVVIDGNIITAKGMGVALEFGEAIVSALCGESAAKNVSDQIFKRESNSYSICALENMLVFDDMTEEQAENNTIKFDIDALTATHIAMQPDKSGVKNKTNSIKDKRNNSDFLNDKKFLEATEAVIKDKITTTSFLQRKLKIGYGKAAIYIEKMVALGVLGKTDKTHAKKVLVTLEEWHDILSKMNEE